MNEPLFPRLSAFLKKHGTYIAVLIILVLLSVMSYCICGKVAADELLIAEWGTKYLFPVVAFSALLLAAFRKYFLSLSVFVGYHAGILLAAVGTDPGLLHFPYAKLTLCVTLIICTLIGVWAEIFSMLLPKWKMEKASAEDVSE